MQRPLWLAIAIVGCLGCSVGIEPPTATKTAYIEGSGADGFRMGLRDIAPCGRFSVVRSRDQSSSTYRFTLPADEVVESERLIHIVDVKPFCIDVHEVTVKQYEHCTLRGTCDRPQLTNAGDEDKPGFIARYYSQADKYADHPVVGVSWQGAQQYCAFRGGRLPTEVEWEFAARSRGLRVNVWSSDYIANNVDGTCEEFRGDIALGGCSQSLHPVGTSDQDVTVEGVFDMAGNASEWTADEFDTLAYCSASQPNGEMLSNLFIRHTDGRTEPRITTSLLSKSSDECLKAGPDQDEYQGKCRLDFDRCISDCSSKIEANDDSDNETAMTCLDGCFEQFDKLCAPDCLADKVLTLCARQPDLTSCRPSPWCAPRENWVSDQQHTVSDRAAGLSTRYVVRGGHFQTNQACEARPTRRFGETVGTPTVGFRCVFPAGTPTCSAP